MKNSSKELYAYTNSHATVNPLNCALKCFSWKIICSLLIVLGGRSVVGQGSISIAAAGTAYTQDFNTLANSTTSSTLPLGWYFNETGTGSNTLYTPGTGSGTAGDTYSFGAASNTDRSLGTLLSGSVTSTIGITCINNSPFPIHTISITYVGSSGVLVQRIG